MKKVGIMSMQRIKNYGSYLQAFALSNMIRKLGHEVEFVDFKIEPCIIPAATKKSVEDIAKEYRDYFYMVENFENQYETKFLKELEIHKRNERPELDTLVIGSDEVFNCLQDNSDVGYSLELFGKEHNAKRLITYAASCGATTIERLNHHDKHEEIAGLLNEFDAISVRDENSKNFVENLSNITPINHLDPVLVYDFKDNVVNNVNIDNYIIVYAYPFNLNDEECKKIKEFAIKHNKKIVSIGNYQKCTDTFIPAHPLEVLPYFEKADFVITNTFHGTIFSIKSHTPFVSFARNYNSEKMTDLLSRLKLEDRMISSLEELEQKFRKETDFCKTDDIIEKEKIRTVEYLKSNL